MFTADVWSFGSFESMKDKLCDSDIGGGKRMAFGSQWCHVCAVWIGSLTCLSVKRGC